MGFPSHGTIKCPLEVNESDDKAEGERELKELTTKQVIELCQQMETIFIEHGSFGGSMSLTKHLQQY